MTHALLFNWVGEPGGRHRAQSRHCLSSEGVLAAARPTHPLCSLPTIKTEPTDDYEPALTCGPMSQGLSPLPKPCYSQQLALPPDPGSCLVAGFPPCLQRSTMMSPPPSTSPKLHDLSSAPYSKGMASPGHGPLGLQRPAAGALAGPEMPRPVGVHPSSPQQPPPALLQPQSCSPTRPPGMGHQQHQLPKVPEKEPAAARPLPLPEVREDSNQGLAPTPVSVKREPQELDQLYLDDGKCPRPQVGAWLCTV
ncbi:hypothetical protein QTO34_002181 [Cnephaeus nilssonii]|uniref:Uncharacterized protein n=1 Tax=Cnephaeus nilssonii TaxID=3371016 RepID=A0AA40HUF3_CNENI|nr:hypothetical protein QTO34_002181 [Eptesicus nilssonii]